MAGDPTWDWAEDWDGDMATAVTSQKPQLCARCRFAESKSLSISLALEGAQPLKRFILKCDDVVKFIKVGVVDAARDVLVEKATLYILPFFVGWVACECLDGYVVGWSAAGMERPVPFACERSVDSEPSRIDAVEEVVAAMA